MVSKNNMYNIAQKNDIKEMNKWFEKFEVQKEKKKG